MRSPRTRILMAVAMAALFPAVSHSQTTVAQSLNPGDVVPAAPSAETKVEADTARPKTKTATSKYMSSAPKIEIQNFRMFDKRGINVYEPPKEEGAVYTGFKLSWGGGFTQQFQGLDHSNRAAPRMVAGVDANKLVQIGHGFNNAEANLNLNAQLAKGVRVALTQYLSTRHHNETWVKDGYFLIDDSPIENAFLENIMKVLTLRVGHFEINYGDAHFRRTDGGNAMFNPLVGNYIMDAFTTEIGAEAYLRKNGWMAMGGITAGEIRGQITKPGERAPSFLGKFGYDKQITPAARVRMMGSIYQTAKSVSNTLYSGDRAGSRYYDVVENTTSTEAAQAWSGAIQPGMKSKIRAVQFNPFVKVGGFEFFGIAEQAKGRAVTETKDRIWTQYAGEALYRFLADERVYVAGRYNTARGELIGLPSKVGVNRFNVGGGWFVTPNVLAKAEYVRQNYNDFPGTDIRSGGKFKGFMVEGVVGF